MNEGITTFDKAWLPFALAGVGVLGYHGIVSEEQASFLTQSLPALIPMAAQAVLVFWRKNK